MNTRLNTFTKKVRVYTNTFKHFQCMCKMQFYEEYCFNMV